MTNTNGHNLIIKEVFLSFNNQETKHRYKVIEMKPHNSCDLELDDDMLDQDNLRETRGNFVFHFTITGKAI